MRRLLFLMLFAVSVSLNAQNAVDYGSMQGHNGVDTTELGKLRLQIDSLDNELVQILAKTLAANHCLYGNRFAMPLCIVWLQRFPLEQWMDADGGGFVFVGCCFAGGGSVYDWDITNIASRTELCQSVRDDCFLYCRFLVPGFGYAPDLAGVEQFVPLTSLFPYIRRPGTERKSFVLFVDGVSMVARLLDSAVPYRETSQERIALL